MLAFVSVLGSDDGDNSSDAPLEGDMMILFLCVEM